MAIKIKRSTGDLAPAQLAAGQLAYVEGALNGGTLFYGEIGGTVREIGGRKIVDKVNGIAAGAQVNTVDSVAGKTGEVTLAAADVTDFDTAVDARITSSQITSELGFTPESSSLKGEAGGYASLDANGFVPATQLPSFVEDVIEVNSITDLEMQFPIGESGKLYVTTDNSQVYRWSGTVYVEIVASPGSTDAVPEGTSNLYFTEQRARELFSADGTVSYDDATGLISGTGLSAVVNDQAPELGGDLDVAGRAIVGNEMFFNGNIRLLPGGADGEVQLGGSVIKVGNDDNTGNTDIGSSAGNLRLVGQYSAQGGAALTLMGGAADSDVLIKPQGAGRTLVQSGNFEVQAGGMQAPFVGVVRNSHTPGSQFLFTQHHETADANNFGMFRSRGSSTVQAAVQSGDDLIDFIVGGNDGSATTSAGFKLAHGFSTIMTAAPELNLLPHRTDYFVNTTAGAFSAYMSVANDAVVRVREIGTVSDVTNLNISAGTDGNIVLVPNGTGRVVIDGTDAVDGVGVLQVGDIVNSGTDDLVLDSSAGLEISATSGVEIQGLKYPAADGTAGQVLVTDGDGVLSFATASSSGVSTFAALTDTPADFTGAGSFFVRVNSAATALEFSQDVDDGSF